MVTSGSSGIVWLLSCETVIPHKRSECRDLTYRPQSPLRDPENGSRRSLAEFTSRAASGLASAGMTICAPIRPPPGVMIVCLHLPYLRKARPSIAFVAMTHILLVEDNEDLAFGLQRTLEAEGYDVSVAADGPAGVEAVTRVRPALVILDLMLPGMDGYQVLESIRKAKHEMPVLILTARGEEADKVVGFRLGADDYVTKPFGLSELLARVNALLRRARAITTPTDRLSFGAVEINLAAHTVTKGGTRIALTPKEFELLITLLQRP